MALLINPIRFIRARKLGRRDLMLALWFTIVAMVAAFGIMRLLSLQSEGRFLLYLLSPAIGTTFLFVLLFGRPLLERRSFWLAVVYGAVTPFLSTIVGLLPLMLIMDLQGSGSAETFSMPLNDRLFGWFHLGVFCFMCSFWITVPIGILGSLIANRFATVKVSSNGSGTQKS